jgi:predicted oxidoreductase
MKNIKLGDSPIEMSTIVLGCMNIGGGWNRDPVTPETISHVEVLVNTALECGINTFDHADIYQFGKSETAFGQVLKQQPNLRDRIIIQTKCGIRFSDDPQPGMPGRYDFSRRHIIASVEGSLQRLQTDYVDILLLHRPDLLMNKEDVAEAFEKLHASGKVRYFGVSNFYADQIAWLQTALKEKLIINQIELSLLNHRVVSDAAFFNTHQRTDLSANRTLLYCDQQGIAIQAWSPLGKGVFSKNAADIQDENIRNTRNYVHYLAAEKSVSTEAIVLSWLLRLSFQIFPVIGTTRPERIRAATQASRELLSREEWYQLQVLMLGQGLP